MKLLVLLVILAVVALAVFLIARAIHRFMSRWEPDINPLPNGDIEVIVKSSWDGKEVIVDTIEAGQDDLDRNLELEMARDEAKTMARSLNRRK